MAGSVADATPGSLAIAKPGRSTAVDLTDVSKSRPHSLVPAGADPNAGEEGEEDDEEEDESGGEGKEEKKDGEESEAEPEMPDEKSVTFGESSDLRVNADVVSALWPKNIGKLRAPAAQVASWKEQRKALKRPKNFEKQRPFTAAKLREEERPDVTLWARGPPQDEGQGARRGILPHPGAPLSALLGARLRL